MPQVTTWRVYALKGTKGKSKQSLMVSLIWANQLENEGTPRKLEFLGQDARMDTASSTESSGGLQNISCGFQQNTDQHVRQSQGKNYKVCQSWRGSWAADLHCKDKIKEVLWAEKRKRLLVLQSWFLNTILQLEEERLLKETASSRTGTQNAREEPWTSCLESAEVLKK